MVNPCSRISKVDECPCEVKLFSLDVDGGSVLVKRLRINPLNVEALAVVGLESLALGEVVPRIGMLCFALVHSVEGGVLSCGAGWVVLVLGVSERNMIML